MRRPLRPAFLLSTLLAVPALAQATPPRHLLRLHFEVGKVQYCRQSTSMQMTMAMGSGRVQTSMQVELVMSSKVVAVQDGKAELHYTVHRVAVKAEGPTRLDYDSDVEGADPGPLRRSVDIVGKVIRARMDDRGRTSDVQLPEGIAAEAVQMLGSGGIDSLIGQNLPVLPEQPIAVGDSWQTEIPSPSGALRGARLKATNKLVGFEAGRITLAQQVELELGDAKVPAGGTVKLEPSGGTMVIDCATGLPASLELQMAIDVQGEGVQMRNTVATKGQAIEPPAPKPKAPGAAGR